MEQAIKEGDLVPTTAEKVTTIAKDIVKLPLKILTTLGVGVTGLATTLSAMPPEVVSGLTEAMNRLDESVNLKAPGAPDKRGFYDPHAYKSAQGKV